MNVYIVERGSYEDRYIDNVFLTRRAALRYVREGMREAYRMYLASVVLDWDVTCEQALAGFDLTAHIIEHSVADDV